MNFTAVNFDNFLTDMWKLLGLPIAATTALLLLTWPILPDLGELASPGQPCLDTLPYYTQDRDSAAECKSSQRGPLENIGSFFSNLYWEQDGAGRLQPRDELLADTVLFTIFFYFFLVFILDQVMRLVGNAIYYFLRRQNLVGAIKFDELGNVVFDPELQRKLFKLDTLEGVEFFRGSYRNIEETIENSFRVYKHGLFFAAYSLLITFISIRQDDTPPLVSFMCFFALLPSFFFAQMGWRNMQAAIARRDALINAAYKANEANFQAQAQASPS